MNIPPFACLVEHKPHHPLPRTSTRIATYKQRVKTSAFLLQVLPATPGPSSLPMWRHGAPSGDLTEPLHPIGSPSRAYGQGDVPYCCKWRSFYTWATSYIFCLALVGLFGAYASPTTAIIMLAFLPNIFLLAYLARTYRHCVLVKQGVATFLEAAVIMCPLVILENLW